MENGKKKVVLISPHLDDAVFSMGGLMAALAAEGHELHVITCFTRSVLRPIGFALACQLDKGLSADVDYMELRRQEDFNACQLLNAHPHWLDLPEAPHRGYHSATTLFQEVLPEDQIQPELLRLLREKVDTLSPDLILSPAGIGHHVDHQQVKQAVSALQEHFTAIPFLRWYDEPYLSRNPTQCPRWTAVPIPAGWEGLSQQILSPVDEVTSISVEPYWEAKIAACAAYATQIGFQFGGQKQIGDGLTKYRQGQRYFTELIV